MMSKLSCLYLSAAMLTGLAVMPVRAADSPDAAGVVANYADIGAATFGDALTSARELQAAVDKLIAEPTQATLDAARAAWTVARVPYQQSEVYRFGNPMVDDWEGRVNSWPLDEGLIDYVDASFGQSEENPLATLNVIATPEFTLSGAQIDASTITPDLIATALHEADGIEANVASGYHAVEFLLWGQDLNGTGPGAGARSWTDFARGEGCTNGNCDRRADYLTAATDLLVADLAEMAAEWAATGAARAAVMADPGGIGGRVLVGLGSLSYGEMAGQRMRLGLLLNDPEEEHDCFSDNTHNSHYYDGLGMRNVYRGSYTRTDGSVVSGPSPSDLVAAADPAIDAQLQSDLVATMAALGAIKAAAEGGMAYDQMLAAGNRQGNTLIMGGVDALVAQTKTIERAATALGTDATQNPDDMVFQ